MKLIFVESYWCGDGHYRLFNYSVYFSENQDASTEGVAFLTSNDKINDSIMVYETTNELCASKSIIDPVSSIYISTPTVKGNIVVVNDVELRRRRRTVRKLQQSREQFD